MNYHNKLTKLLELTNMNDIIQETQLNSLQKYFIRDINNQYYAIDALEEEIINMKKSHIDEILQIKEKLNSVIDLNYKLHKELTKYEALTQNPPNT